MEMKGLDKDINTYTSKKWVLEKLGCPLNPRSGFTNSECINLSSIIFNKLLLFNDLHRIEDECLRYRMQVFIIPILVKAESGN